MTEIVRIFVGLDGTYNHMDNDIKVGDSSETNIAKLRTLYIKQGYEQSMSSESDPLDMVIAI